VDERELFRQAADYAADFLESLETRPVRAEGDFEQLERALGRPVAGGRAQPAGRARGARRGCGGLVSSRSRRAATSASSSAAACRLGATIVNDVVLNQVLVRFGDGERTREVIRRVQEDGTCWVGGTEWQGEHAMRISVSNWRTTEEDVDRSVDAILRAAAPLTV
jgi:hypothetical protein